MPCVDLSRDIAIPEHCGVLGPTDARNVPTVSPHCFEKFAQSVRCRGATMKWKWLNVKAAIPGSILTAMKQHGVASINQIKKRILEEHQETEKSGK